MKSFRRHYLDLYLSENINFLNGRVLDLGGKKISKRGEFIPPLNKVKCWEYLNIDSETNPDYCCSAEKIPLKDSTVDVVIMTEVLEYLQNPETVFSEIYRVLCKEGHVIISTPFLNPIHGDFWYDRARYSPVMLREKLGNAGLIFHSIKPMGSVGSVIYDILRAAFGYADENDEFRIYRKILPKVRFLFSWLDSRMKSQSKFINTGYFLVLKK